MIAVHGQNMSGFRIAQRAPLLHLHPYLPFFEGVRGALEMWERKKTQPYRSQASWDHRARSDSYRIFSGSSFQPLCACCLLSLDPSYDAVRRAGWGSNGNSGLSKSKLSQWESQTVQWKIKMRLGHSWLVLGVSEGQKIWGQIRGRTGDR